MRFRIQNYRIFVWTKIERFVLFFLLPYLLFVLMESYDRNPYTEIYPKAFFFNVLLFELAAIFFFLLTGSACASIRILAAFSLLFGLTNHYVMLFRSTPFVPWDLLSLGTGKSVVAEYDFTPSIRVCVITLALLVIFVWSRILHLHFRGYWRARLLGALVIAVILVLFGNALQNRKFQVESRLYPHVFTPDVMVKRNGATVTFLMDLAYVHVDKPKGYHVEDVASLFQDDAFAGEIADTKVQPNIIVIMDEAFSDLSVLSDFTTSEDPLPYIHSLQSAENVVSGYLYMPVCGGNTANSEFEFLTGHSMAFLPGGSVPYQQYIKGELPSMASLLKEQGYETVAMHPYLATGWCRDQVYPRMGFDQMYFYNDMKNLHKVRKYTSDASDFSNILTMLKDKEQGKPLFLFNVTMQNHGGYTDTYDDFTNDVTVTSVKKQNDALNQYLSLIKLTDQAVEELLGELMTYEEPTLVVFFGDHQPSDVVTRTIAPNLASQESDFFYADEDSFTSLDQENLRYKVPYFVWANYEMEDIHGLDMSSNYLGANVLKIAGLERNTYFDFLLRLQEHYPVISPVYTKTISPDEEGLLQYEAMQYYQLFDWEEN